MPEKNNIGLDTTIILRLLIGEPETQFKKARQFVEDQVGLNKKLFVTDLVISETYFALYYHYEVPKKEVIRQINNLLTSGAVYPAPGSVCKRVFENTSQHKAGLVDQLIYEQYCVFAEQVASFDKSMGKFTKTVML